MPRYILFATPFLALLVGEGLARMAPVPRLVAGVTLAGAIVLGVQTYRDVLGRDTDYRPVAGRLITDARPSDAILVQPPESRVPLSYYLRHTPLRVRATAPGTGLVDVLQGDPTARTWLVLDYRSKAYAATPAALAAALARSPGSPMHVESDRYDVPGSFGVRVVAVAGAVPRTPSRPPAAGTP